jgi:hypothetical protein
MIAKLQHKLKFECKKHFLEPYGAVFKRFLVVVLSFGTCGMKI